MPSLPYAIACLIRGGCKEAIAYHQARHPEDAGRLLSTWLLLLVPLAIIAGWNRAPSFRADKDFDWGDRAKEAELHRYYGMPPYGGF